MEEPTTNLSELLNQKEKEYQEICKLRLLQLEDQLNTKNTYIKQLLSQIEKIQEDFNYNVQLIDERDTELIELESKIDILKKLIKEKDTDISELRAYISNLEEKVKTSSSKNTNREKSLISERDELREKIIEIKINKESEIAELKSAFEKGYAKIRQSLEESKAEKFSLIEKYEKMLENQQLEHNKIAYALNKELEERKIHISSLIKNIEEIQKTNSSRITQDMKVELENSYRAQIKILEEKLDSMEKESIKKKDRIRLLEYENQELKDMNIKDANFALLQKNNLEKDIAKLKSMHNDELKYITETHEIQIQRITTLHSNQIKKLQEKLALAESELEKYSIIFEEAKSAHEDQEKTLKNEINNLKEVNETEIKARENIISNIQAKLKIRADEIESYKGKIENWKTIAGQSSEEIRTLKEALWNAEQKIKNFESYQNVKDLEKDELQNKIQNLEAKLVLAYSQPKKEEKEESRLWSEDLGPASSIASYDSQGNQIIKENYQASQSIGYEKSEGFNYESTGNNQGLTKKIKELEDENSGLKRQIKQQGGSQIATNNAEIKQFIEKCQRMKAEIIRLTNERDQLIQISSELRYEVNRLKESAPAAQPPVENAADEDHILLQEEFRVEDFPINDAQNRDMNLEIKGFNKPLVKAPQGIDFKTLKPTKVHKSKL
ncbi:unnamed protein product [Blepharisma stoltei]|uniref:Uncharacterized protein n=1 Tax=Blepharisma stoltei TaxID=1481888 RepID=A0AAU9JRC8_9CILI|nr:unnamed protein product [Blepharisma stoltei]